MRAKRVYIAMPYAGKGEEVGNNIREAINIAEAVLYRTKDWLPYVPHLFHLWHLVSPHPVAFWIRMDNDWLTTCQALLRLGGASEGADRDMTLAADIGITVFLSLDEFLEYAKED